ncbi:dentin sialophosphoprotein [Toxorhynchites rutilus septentrionalis]|uniref:dentin sialophosphoprotein n=1 Tax=Toxorhynchites rutilus septentrionalis TaxID=329112 RepID=UPI00247A6FD2|nr:dentin sialophosphoprotein [Toxorhynchites rutilus septentrionalis]XP_055641603.1 dentin sialophosphoprotein [Toxorhynchites rutilus septentrionalis]XP_055641611.1 dentin sialophosphoprotein [Toxorhynchites rutilus septentrionalis]XP_055641620.1 dentin sialophosphoprotein [Toxorhynchites rutilus septentrionalis]
MIKVSKETGVYAALVSVVSGAIVWFNFRPLGIFFVSSLVVFWCRQYANIRLQMTPLLEDKLRNGCHRALKLRAEKPGLFCALISCFLVLLAIIGHVVSGAYIVVALLVLSIVISTKYDIKIVADRERVPTPLPVNLLDQEVDEFLPDVNEANASLLQQVGEEADVSAVYKTDSTISERKSGDGEENDDDDDTYSDLLIPQSSIKELEEEQSSESSSDELLLGDGTNSTGENPVDEIKFKSSHFNANSSSDSDDSISRGLSFDDIPDKGSSRKKSHQQQQQLAAFQPQPEPRFQSQPSQFAANLAGTVLAGNVLSYLTSAMTSASLMSQSQPAPGLGTQKNNRMTVSSASTTSGRRAYVGDSTDEDEASDFEMLNPDELNNA